MKILIITNCLNLEFVEYNTMKWDGEVQHDIRKGKYGLKTILTVV